MKVLFLRIELIVTKKKKMQVLSYIPISRYSSGIKYEIHPFCSLHLLACHIDILYNKLSDIFPKLSAYKVAEIKKRINDGTYTLSPLLLSSFSKSKIGELKRPKYSYIMHVNAQPNLCYCVNPTQEDSLVLMGLGIMINHKIVQNNLLMENSLGLRTLLKDYLGIVCSRVNISRFYKFDLTNSMKSINRDHLFV